MMTRLQPRLTILFTLVVLPAGCGSVSARTNATPTATLTPTATPSPMPLSGATQEQFMAVCPKGFGITSSGVIYHLNDLYVAISLSISNFPATKLPDGTPLKPFNLNGRPSTTQGPAVNPKLDAANLGGASVDICNASASVGHSAEGATARIDGATAYSGELNSWQPCDGVYTDGRADDGCGVASPPRSESMHASFDASAGAGATVVAARNNPCTAISGTPCPPLPVALAPGADLPILIAITPPTASALYRFSVSVRVDGANLPFAPLANDVLLAPARKWSGPACLKPEMQAQIPAGSKDDYICPTSTT